MGAGGSTEGEARMDCHRPGTVLHLRPETGKVYRLLADPVGLGLGDDCTEVCLGYCRSALIADGRTMPVGGFVEHVGAAAETLGIWYVDFGWFDRGGVSLEPIERPPWMEARR